jgi:hypothetical protein
MPVLVDAIKAAVLAAHPEAMVAERTLNGIKHAIAPLGGRERFVLDTAIGHYHYYDAGSPVEINTDWADETGAWVDGNHGSGARILSGTTGTRRLYPRRDHMDEYVEFARPQYWTGAAWANVTLPGRTRTGDTVTWDATAFAISVVLTGCQVKLSVTLKTAAAAKRIRWPITLTGLTRTGWQLFSGTTVVCDIPQPRLVDAAGTERAVEAYIRNGAVEFIADITGLTYPVIIDPPLDYQVGSGPLDFYIAYNAPGSGGSFWPNFSDLMICSASATSHNNAGVVFTSVTIPDGATIGAAYMSCKAYDSRAITTATLALYAEKAASPDAPTSAATYWARTMTTAAGSWSPAAWTSGTWYDSGSFTGPLAELMGSYSYKAGANMHLELRNNGSNDTALRRMCSYNNGASNAAKLHIEYTSAAAPHHLRRAWRR